MDTSEIWEMCREALLVAQKTLKSLGEVGISELEEHVTDISTEGDISVSRSLIEFFRDKIPAILYSEESGRIKLSDKPLYTITFDDIDGTYNYHRGRGVLPYCTVITVFDSTEPRFRDALVAAVLEHNSSKIWHAIRGEGTYLNGSRVRTSGMKELNRRTLIAVDHYSNPDYIQNLLPIYTRAWVKDFGSSALHLAGVSSGLLDGFLNPSHKAHELGAGYLLVKEAGGHISDLEGKPIDDVIYDFDRRYPVVAASTEELGERIISVLK